MASTDTTAGEELETEIASVLHTSGLSPAAGRPRMSTMTPRTTAPTTEKDTLVLRLYRIEQKLDMLLERLG